MSEIKLGWYRTNVVSMFDPVEVVYVSSNQVVFATKNCGLKIEDAATFAKYRDYIGTELGEWVSPDDVQLGELPIRARFRNASHEQWSSDGLLVGSRCNNGIWTFSDDFKLWDQCQVWRAWK